MRSFPAFAVASVLLALLSLASGQTIQFSDTFDRADGSVGNGWTVWNNSDIAGHQLETFGQPDVAGGIGRSLPTEFPVTFSFGFRTAAPSDGGWQIAFNAASVQDLSVAEIGLLQYNGAVGLCYFYQTTSGQQFTCTNQMGTELYDTTILAHISGSVYADLSSSVTIEYADHSKVTLMTPAPSGALMTPQGSLVVLGNSNATYGPHYFDNFVGGFQPGNGIDINKNERPWSVNRWKLLNQAGVQYAVAEGWGGRGASCDGGAQLSHASKATITGGAYCLLNFEQNKAPTGDYQVDRCMLGPIKPSKQTCTTPPPYVPFAIQSGSSIIWNFKPSFIAIDVEKEGCFGSCVSPDVALVIIQAAIKRATKKYQFTQSQVVIYSDEASWSVLTGDSNQFVGYPLWESTSGTTFGSPPECGDGMANFDNFPGSYFYNLGWQTLSGKQYDLGPAGCSGTELLGVPADLNYFASSILP
jgi:hypothetical protein